MKNLVVLSGAGISAESGLKTFRDADGLWEGHRVTDVATPEGFQRDPELVLEFYNERRRQLLSAKPNLAHTLCAGLQPYFHVEIITQNVDDLHERAGSKHVLHLHGELLKVRSTYRRDLVYPWNEDLKIGNLCEFGSQLRPHIVWFGEDVPMIYDASIKVQAADIILVIGTSLQVYPAAGLLTYAQKNVDLFYIDPKPQLQHEINRFQSLNIIADKATTGLQSVYNELMKLAD
ncbi:MAG: NAD-dependent deacylase [Saprospiraceae bacterium]|nr:NAD-dependent deacylase [Saprospiraceae bacterium]